MTDLDPTLMADSFVSLAAFCGLVIMISGGNGTALADPMGRRIRFGFSVLAVLMASRLLEWWTGFGMFAVLTTMAAGLVPLSTILFSEGLVRRHAPAAVKAVVAGGAVAFVPLSLMPASLVEPWRYGLLFVFQLCGFVMAAILVLGRDRASLSRTENRTVDRIALSLLLILPLMITDYRTLFADQPVRLGGLAILFLCWLMISLGERTASHRDTLVAAALVAVVSLAAAAAITLGEGGDGRRFVQILAIVLSSALLGMIAKDRAARRAEFRRQSLIRHLAEGRAETVETFLAGLQNHPLVEGSLILGEKDLGDFDLADLAACFEKHPVASRPEPLRAEGQVPDEDEETLSWLLEKHEATHVMLVSHKPLLLVALNIPALATTHGAEAELRAVQRMALMISERGAVVTRT